MPDYLDIFTIIDHPAFYGPEFPWSEVAIPTNEVRFAKPVQWPVNVYRRSVVTASAYSISTISPEIRMVEHPEHAAVNDREKGQCADCGMMFQLAYELENHGKQHFHRPFGCSCGGQFTRADALSRHLNRYSNRIPKHPCTYCKHHRGPNGFRRRDHLLQHLRGYHKLDAETPFPCRVLGYNRVGARGFVGEEALLHHHRLKHADAPSFILDAEVICELQGSGP